MKPNIKPFVDAILEKDAKKARERFEEIDRRLDPSDEFWRGYRLALHGIVAAIEAGDELMVIRRILEGRYPRENIQELIKQMNDRLSNAFRPKDERGFNTAWVDVLQIILPRLSA